MAQSAASLRSVLARFGTDRFNIEYEGFKSNHLMHALVALNALGASPDRLQGFAERRITEHKYDPAAPSEGDLTGDGWRSLLGRRKRFTDLRKFFVGEVRSLGVDGAMGKYVTPLLNGGVSCAAFHAIIHLGYGLLSDVDQEVADGVAYVVYAHRLPLADDGVVSAEKRQRIADCISSVDSPRPSWAASLPREPPPLADGFLRHPLCGVLLKMRRDVRLQRLIPLLQELVDARGDELLSTTGYGRFSSRLFLIQDGALDIVQEHLDASGLLHDIGDEQQLSSVMAAVMQGMLLAYASTAVPDEFFMLHGLTSAYCVHVLLPRLPSFEARREAVRVYCRDVLCVYVLRNLPELVPWRVQDIDGGLPSWDEIKRHTVPEQEEHLVKVVFTCLRLEEEFGAELMGAEVYRAVAACKSHLRKWPR